MSASERFWPWGACDTAIRMAWALLKDWTVVCLVLPEAIAAMMVERIDGLTPEQVMDDPDVAAIHVAMEHIALRALAKAHKDQEPHPPGPMPIRLAPNGISDRAEQ